MLFYIVAQRRSVSSHPLIVAPDPLMSRIYYIELLYYDKMALFLDIWCAKIH